MELQGRNLSIQMQSPSGDNVKLLHSELTQLGLAISENERAEGRFGESTYEAVKIFQEKYGLPATGEVDDKTAAEINRQIASLDPKLDPQPELFVVRGFARYPDQRPASGFAQAFDTELGEALPLGEAATDADGKYEVTYSVAPLASLGKKRPDLVVRLLSASGTVLVTSPVRPQAKQLEMVDLVVPAGGVEENGGGEPPGSGQPNGLAVQGHVRSAGGSPAVGFVVMAWDADLPSLRRDEPLGNIVTDKDGFYRIEYGAEKFSSAEKDSADLRVEVHDPNDSGALLAVSPVRYNAQPVETIDLVLEVGSRQELSEYERLLAEIDPLRGPVAVPDLTPADVEFLAGETGADRHHLELLVTAHRHGMQTGGEPAIFYGLMREDLPTDLPALLAQEPEVHRATLKRAVADNIIPANLGDTIDACVAQLQDLRIQSLLHYPGSQGPTQLAALLSTALPTGDQQQALLALYTRHQGDVETFWENLPKEKGFEEPELVTKLQYTLQLNVLTGGNVPLVQALAADGSINATKDLVGLDTAAWQARIAALGPAGVAQIPPNIRGSKDEEKIANYAGSIVETLKAAFPSQYLVNAITAPAAIDLGAARQVLDLNKDRALDLRQPLPGDLKWDGVAEGDRKKVQEALAALRAELNIYPGLDASAVVDGQDGFYNPIRAGVEMFLGQAKDFDFGKSNIDVYIQEHGSAAFGDIPEEYHGAVGEQLKSFQRVYQVVPRNESVMALMGEGLHSALAIADMPPGLFVETFADKVGGAFQAQLIYENAGELRDRAALALSSAVQLTTEVFPRAIGAPGATKDGNESVAPQAAPRAAGEDVRSLYASAFGKLNLCACEHCRSVYSPAAYLVDLLHFLDRQVPGHGNPYRVLTARRPDIPLIPLTCENTNTALPYIDLVNEILESYIVLGSSAGANPTGDRRSTSAELLANPQHVNTAAYSRLKTAVYPMTLPFDRDLEIVRAYLAHLGLSRHAVMEAHLPWGAVDDAGQAAFALEYLKISPEEGELLAGVALLPEEDGDPAPAPDTLVPHSYLGTYYGFEDASDAELGWSTSLASVETFLARTGLQYDELVELLKTRLINPEPAPSTSGTIVIHTVDEACDLAARTLRYRGGNPLKSPAWDCFQRFIRLWRKLGWPIHDVDRALTALRATPDRLRDGSFLRDLSFAVQVMDALGLGLAETLSFWHTIDTHGDDDTTRQAGSLYARLFLNPAVRTLAGDGDPFALNAGGTELHNTELGLAGQTITDLAAAILAALRVSAADLPYLRTMALLENDRASLENLSKLHRCALLARALRLPPRDLLTLCYFISDPFADPQTTLAFVKRARKVLASRFTPADLAYIYLHSAEPAGTVAPDPQDVTACLLAVRGALRELTESVGKAEPLETRLRKALGQVMDQARIDAALKLLDYAVVYTAKLSGPVTVTFPEALRTRIIYDAGQTMLRFEGVMSRAEQTELRGLVSSSGYPEAIDSLYQQPRAYAARELGQFVSAADVEARLLSGPADAVERRQAYLLDRVLAYLSRSLVAQTLAEHLGLNAALADRLLADVLPRQASGGTGKLVEDFLALREGALDAQYFGGTAWAGAGTARIDPPVDFAGSGSWPELTFDRAGGFSARWTGELVVPATQTYTFVVRTSGPVKLKVDGEDLIPLTLGRDPEVRASCKLQGGRVYPVVLEAAFGAAPYTVQLAWESPTLPRTVIGEDQLFPMAAWESAVRSFLLLHKAAKLVAGFGMTDAELVYLGEHGDDYEGFRFGNLPLDPVAPEVREAAARAHFQRWERLHDLFAVLRSVPHADRLLALFAAAKLPGTTVSAATDRLVAASGWDRQAVEEVLGLRVPVVTATFFADERGPKYLAESLALARRTGMSPRKLFDCAQVQVGPAQAETARNAVKARYDAPAWLAVAKAINDPLRERQRDALVAYILAQPGIPVGIRTSLDLFEYFLVDVDMSSCLPTSRIKQAISSVQLFVQRCLMNLERGVSPRLLPANQWQWMRSYRVWEANRKVFLYPENWIEPELRDDKSPFFKELENELLQNDLTLETAETAFLNYLEKLDEVARLDVRGMYWEYESGLDPATGERFPTDWRPDGWGDEYWTNVEVDPRERTDVLHVFARTQGTPPIYYYRRLINHKQWTPWEKVQADIEGDHLIPVVFNRRLYLFWPLFRETTDSDPTGSQQSGTARPPDKRLEIKLAWTEFFNGKWSAKKVSEAKIEAEYAPPEWRSDFFFKVRTSGENLHVDCLRRGEEWTIIEYTDARQLTPRRITRGIIRPGAMATSYLVEAVLAPIEDRIRQMDDILEPLRDLYLRIADGFRQAARERGMTFARWERNVRVFFVGRIASPLSPSAWNLPHVWGYVSVGYFTLTGCDREVAATSSNRFISDQREWPALPDASVIDGQKFRVDGPSLQVFKPNRTLEPVLGNTDEQLIPRPSYLLYPHQYYPYLLQAPFFYRNGERAYYVSPEQVASIVQQVASPRTVAFTLSAAFLVSPSAASSGLAAPVDGAGLRALAPAPNPVSNGGDRQTWDDQQACVGDNSLAYRDTGTQPAHPTTLRLRFHTFFHPYICDFVKRLKRRSVPGLLRLEPQKLSDYTRDGADPSGDRARTQFKTRYHPQGFVDLGYPKEDVDFGSGAYALYNWELFFHVPLLIADRLSDNQRFDEARQWYHYILDPTTSSTEPIPRRYWNVLPFYRNDLAPRDQISDLLYLLSERELDAESSRRKAELEAQIDAWRSDPFNPHRIARMRLTAYQKMVLMKYIDNLIAWGDQLFQRDTMESINEAAQLYIMAYQLLGPRPKFVPPSSKPRTQVFADLRTELDRFSNALVSAENGIAGRRCLAPTATGWGRTAGTATLGTTLYFCIPPNDKLLGYWDMVEDRLFKIRHCMNIEGIVRQLPLFEPPIDPALLVRARAAGLDLSRVLNEINAALPHYRFNVMFQKALELCGEVRAVGAALLSALEKHDAEALTLLRSTHEIRLLEAAREVRKRQADETMEAIEGLLKSKEVVELRRDFYRDIMRLTPEEIVHLALQGAALGFQVSEIVAMLAVPPAYQVPSVTVGAAGWAASPVNTYTFAGNTGDTAEAAAKYLGILASVSSAGSSLAASIGSYNRRWDEWKHQERLANKEIEHIDKQIAAARIRQEIATKELQNHELQVENARAVDEFMRSKFTNRELYDWMVAQTSALYFQAYQLAYDLAKRAERAYQFERGITSSSFVQFGHWDSLRKGLLAGERLSLDLKRLEVAYMDQNRREYEITKHVSLVLHDPINLIALKKTGSCEIDLPEALFDMDYPGHYMRRLKAVSVTIPAVVGPYTSINGTLTLLRSSIRKNAGRASSYAEQQDDDRFLYNFAPIQSIATSHGQNDSGLFELNFRDERYLPFEGAGAISRWRLEIPRETSAFDLDTITDIVLRLNYTAREGGADLRSHALAAATLPAMPAPAPLAPSSGAAAPTRPNQDQLLRLFSLRHEFPTEWHRFIQAADTTRTLTLGLTRERFPYPYRGKALKTTSFDVILLLKPGVVYPGTGTSPTTGSPVLVSLAPVPAGSTSAPAVPLNPDVRFGQAPFGQVTLDARGTQLDRTWVFTATNASLLEAANVEDIVLICHYAARQPS